MGLPWWLRRCNCPKWWFAPHGYVKQWNPCPRHHLRRMKNN